MEREIEVGPMQESGTILQHDDYMQYKHSFSSLIDDPPLAECFLNHPVIEECGFPLDYKLIMERQFEDEKLQKAYKDYPAGYVIDNFSGDINLICSKFRDPQVKGELKRIWVPDPSVGPMVTWYYLALNHVGRTRLFDTIHMNFVHPKMYRRA